MSHNAQWSWSAMMDCAAACRTWKEFCVRFPLAYGAAYHRNLIDALKEHCGYDSDGLRTYDAPRRFESLKDILADSGKELPDALHDPKWPMLIEPTPLREELD